MIQLTIFNDIAADSDILDILKQVNIVEYSRIMRTTGQGHRTGPREDSHIWPGYNAITIAVCEEAKANLAIELISTYRNSPEHDKTGVFAFTSPVLNYTK